MTSEPRLNREVKYRAYLIRLWRLADDHWRVSLDDPHTGERLAFSTLEQCMEYLQSVTSAKPPKPDDSAQSP